ncbi:hypothetical protein Pst134EA_022970 [Puccinia striiformis f. sp. tritici]|uniref:hypothetical protein n=1 Tax=Puccinia striiformis f. sp. tritici TaxID=168172 RepID=UPI0020078410|nr:hypothetical protein Pst134EA_022970 [Puccinia striiformis f. sp. tritici]KAH9455508.1 hypothetical protein Pst134EA_022970 [Puccinia striiformis f. sp. tritici]
MDVNKEFFKDSVARFQSPEGRAEIEKVKKLTQFAKDKLGCSVGQLALAWAASHNHVSTVILGATKPEQLKENFGALQIIDKLTPEIKEEIESIMDNKPVHPLPLTEDNQSQEISTKKFHKKQNKTKNSF